MTSRIESTSVDSPLALYLVTHGEDQATYVLALSEVEAREVIIYVYGTKIKLVQLVCSPDGHHSGLPEMTVSIPAMELITRHYLGHFVR